MTPSAFKKQEAKKAKMAEKEDRQNLKSTPNAEAVLN